MSKDGQGYLEDRRPSSNCDPYMVTAAMVTTTVLDTVEETPALETADETVDETADEPVETPEEEWANIGTFFYILLFILFKKTFILLAYLFHIAYFLVY